MYYPNQVIHDIGKNRPAQIGGDVWDGDSYPPQNTHYVYSDNGKIATPKTIAEAEELLRLGTIRPSW